MLCHLFRFHHQTRRNKTSEVLRAKQWLFCLVVVELNFVKPVFPAALRSYATITHLSVRLIRLSPHRF